MNALLKINNLKNVISKKASAIAVTLMSKIKIFIVLLMYNSVIPLLESVSIMRLQKPLSRIASQIPLYCC